MLRRLSVILVAVVWGTFAAGTLHAGEPRPTAEFRLWEKDAPGAHGTADVDIPTLTPFWPAEDKASGAAMIVCPGGGYNVLAPHEGKAYAEWLNQQGIAAFVLKYRLYKSDYHLPEIFKDAQRAMRTVRYRAADWKLDPKRVGIMGSSAGGHLSSVMLTQFDAGKSDSADPIEKVSSRPDLGVLCYGFIQFDKKTMTDPARREKALGKDVSDKDALFFASARNVRKDTPPCFIWQTVEDTSVTVDNALEFANGLREAGVPFDLHLYQKGKHGIGLGKDAHATGKLHPWTDDCIYWLNEQRFIK